MKNKIICISLIAIFILTGFESVGSIEINKDIINDEKEIDTLSGGPSSCAIIVVGGPGEACHVRTGQRAKRIYENNGYNVKYLLRPSKSDVESAITSWIPSNIGGAKKIALIFVDHGSMSGFSLGTQTMTPSDLSGWLNQINGQYSNCLVFIEACHAGVFVTPELSSRNRIIITSTSKYTLSFKDPADESYFSKEFFIAVEEGASYGEAWMRADELLDSFPLNIAFAQQNPWIDDNGDSIAHGTYQPDSLPLGGDGNLALSTHAQVKSKSYDRKSSTSIPLYKILRSLANINLS